MSENEHEGNTQMSSKERLIEALKSSERDLLDRLGALLPAEFEKGAYENGWNRRQIFAHIASIERTYPQLIAIARGDLPMPEPAGTDQRCTEQPYRPSTAGPVHASNQRQVDKLTEASTAELLTLFEKNRAATIAAVQAADDALFEKEVRTTGGLQGPLGRVLELVAVEHVRGHVNDIVGVTP
jgi:hypothetical protein